MPRLKKADYNERFNQIKTWSEKINKNVKVLGGTRGGLTEIICNHERTSLEDNEKNILKGTIKELEFLGSNIRGHIEVDFKSEKANVICNFASEYILNNNIIHKIDA